MIVILNSSPLVASGRVQQLHLFQRLFGTIYIPATVYQETVTQGNNPIQQQAIVQAIEEKFIEVVSPASEHTFSRKLHPGERDVLNMALEIKADLLIIDDRKARNEARELGFAVNYTSTIVKAAEKRGCINSYQILMNTLKDMSIYLPEE